ncbi:UDP-galactose:(Galactosyl) LPS alpha-1,2-galactosyltransferase [Paramixta manurensis]|uniref:UDP-galactose:(Galactosyl) LPS alpha-1,2-galactosyltransferase n=1 Tax=Paramixta manurensis TaxID=2740817 RepID=A0A6M8UVD4_9GAMM|nr:UDP-galactose:(Galactosyl) LPS alpha-1,2-galactosyltransferase [Erwiniaceae bacterium PD-1]
MDIVKEGISNIYTLGKVDKHCGKPILDIAYGVDNDFLLGAAISMQSIALHNSDILLRFHIFTDSINDDYLKRVKDFTNSRKNTLVRIYKISDGFNKIFPSARQWSYATFFRFIAFEYLSGECDKVLYLDADVICKGNLYELFEIKFDRNHFVAVVRDIPYMQGKPAIRLNIDNLAGNYFNAGVIFIMLSEWKSRKLSEKAINMLADDPMHVKYKCLDQDILNILFFSHCLFMSGNYNCFYGLDYELKNKDANEYKKTIHEDTKLIHYVGVTKPWHNWTDYPCQKFFNDAFLGSAWCDIPLSNAKGEKQLKLKYRHYRKSGCYISATFSYSRYIFEKLKRIMR